MKKVLKIMSMVGVIAIMIIVACVSAKFNTKAMNNKNENKISLCIEQKAYTKEEKIIRNKAEEERKNAIEYINYYFDLIENLTEDSNEYLGQHSATFWRSTNNLDAKSSIEKLSIPMLILQGKDDFQVFADKDYVEWQKLLNGRDNCHFKLYDGLNHFFMKSNGYKIFDGNKEYLVPGHVDQRVLDDMAEFINMYSK